LHVDINLRRGFWSVAKIKIRKIMADIRQGVNTKLKDRFMGEWLGGVLAMLY